MTPLGTVVGPLSEREWAAVLLAADEKAQVLTPVGVPTAAVLRNRSILLLAKHGLRGVDLPGLTLGDVASTRRGTTINSIALPSHDEPQSCAGCAVVDWAEIVTAHRADGDAGVWVAVRRERSRRSHRCRRSWSPPPEFADAPLFRTVSKAGRLGSGAVSRERLRSTLLSAARRAGITRSLGIGDFGSGHGPLSQVTARRPVARPGIVTVTESPTGAGREFATGSPAGPGAESATGSADRNQWAGCDSSGERLTGAVAPATRRAYLADWGMFEAWCRAHDRTALPATPDTVEAFLADHPAPDRTHHRRRTSIRHIHRHADHPRPAVTRPRRPGRPLKQAENLSSVLRMLPRTGWTRGIFGRRDALLLLLRLRGGLTVRELHGLTTADLARHGGDLHVRLGGDTVVLRRTRRSTECPGCCWMRWQVLLRHAAFHSPATVLAGLLSGTPNDEHLCDREEQLELGGPVPVFPPLNRWGAFPLPLHPASPRSLITLIGQHVSGTAVEHPTVRIRITPPRVPVEPVRPPVDPRTTAQIAAAGVAARRRAVEDLADTKERLEQVEDFLDDLHERLDRLMAVAWPDG